MGKDGEVRLLFELAVDARDHTLLALIFLLHGAQLTELTTCGDKLAVEISRALEHGIDRQLEDQEQDEQRACPYDKQSFTSLQIAEKIHREPHGVLEV